MVQWINEDRAKEGLAPYQISSALTAQARLHSQDMMTSNFFSHTSPNHGTFSERLKASGITVYGAGENIARYGSVEKAHAGLMASPGHRANLMNATYTHIGVGIIQDASGNYYITQWMAKLP